VSGAELRRLVLCLCVLLGAAPAVALLDGAALLQDPLAGALGMTPVLPAAPAARLAVGLWAQGSLRSDRLSFDVWNRFAGRRLEEADKRALLKAVGSSLNLRQALDLSLLEGVWALPAGRSLGLRLEHTGSGGQVVDTRLLESVLFGNDPTQSLDVERADLDAEVLQRLRVAWNTPLPEAWARRMRLPDQVDWTLAAGLLLEQGSLFTRTRSFSAVAPPPQGQVSGRLDMVQEVAGPGFGWGLDLGLRGHIPLDGPSLDLHAALRALPHHQTWRQARREIVRMELPRTPVDATFDYGAFHVEVLDSNRTTSSHDLHLVRSHGWLLAADWSGSAWRHTLAWERLPGDARGTGKHRLSLATSRSQGPWHVRLQGALSSERGPAWGAEGGWSRGVWQVALAGSGYAGLGGASRGGQLGVMCRWLLP
jgi:hypothetical protein